MEEDSTHPVIMADLRDKHTPGKHLNIHEESKKGVKPKTAPHQCHKAQADANIPHLDGFVSGAGQQERARLTALLCLVKNNKEKTTDQTEAMMQN